MFFIPNFFYKCGIYTCFIIVFIFLLFAKSNSRLLFWSHFVVVVFLQWVCFDQHFVDEWIKQKLNDCQNNITKYMNNNTAYKTQTKEKTARFKLMWFLYSHFNSFNWTRIIMKFIELIELCFFCGRLQWKWNINEKQANGFALFN